ncbi:MAG TPA: DUF6398 domain-containing protein [Solirubrobacteraceae bacterium]|nr:DUF6398 domain-containing protein [Solirubrobacteraceae bacterium]
MPATDDKTLSKLKVPMALRGRVVEILEITDAACIEGLDAEYAELCRELVARMARKRPSPLVRGDTRIWAAGALYAVGQLNFLFDPAGRPHLTTDELAGYFGVAKSTMANKAALIRKTLNLGAFEPGLTRLAMLEQHPMAWIVELNGFLVDARTLPSALQDEARRLGLIPDLASRRAAAELEHPIDHPA